MINVGAEIIQALEAGRQRQERRANLQQLQEDHDLSMKLKKHELDQMKLKDLLLKRHIQMQELGTPRDPESVPGTQV